DYALWRSAHRPPDPAVRPAAESRLARDRPVIERRFAGDWGIELPDSIFRYWLFLMSLGPVEQRALDDTDLRPIGIMELFDDPARLPREGLDVRVHGRYYRDPPEFLTFMHGGTDGLHFGLWYDDGRTCAGVASYYNNDGGGVGLPSGTPLEAVRARIEWRQRDLDSETGQDEPIAEDLVRERFGLRALREVLMTFETGDRPEEGDAYHETYRDDDELLEAGDPDRFETLDGGGALVSGEPVVPRGRQRPYDGYEWCTDLHKRLTGDPEAVAAWVTEALRRCAAGDPAGALTLGRDLHWASGGDAGRERQAHELLVAAYRALGRDSLAGITGAHHRHRDLPQVGVLLP
ncbi:HPF1 family protein, partial [Nonomuraea rhizosphaerae]|uniref:HPF1 family protein n=1 Tax=Nonomuraea rhizosphaerae TaxID=2665663 RepID=UPI001C605010